MLTLPFVQIGLTYNRTAEHESDVLSPLASDAGQRGGSGKLRRHRSRGSIATELTFPMRSDAYAATNLRPEGKDPKILPPPLPYPSLAAHSLTTHPGLGMRSVVSNSSAGGGAKTGFFASIGRKTSIRQKDRTLGAFASNHQGTPIRPPIRLGLATSSGTSASGHSHGTSASASSLSAVVSPPKPRPVQIESAPTLPGGPRAPNPRRRSVVMPNLNPQQLFANADAGPRRSPVGAVSQAPMSRTGPVPAPISIAPPTRRPAAASPYRSSMPPPPQHPSTVNNVRTIVAGRRV